MDLFSLLPIAVLFIVIPYLFYRAAKRALEIKLLTEEGMKTTGVIVKKFRAGGRKRRNKFRYLRYSYQNQTGKTFEHSSMVSTDLWNQSEVGQRIDIVYSRSKPQVSAPRAMVELAKEVFRKGKPVSQGE